jgi:hypothetical protein
MAMPALFTRISRRPKRFSISAMTATQRLGELRALVVLQVGDHHGGAFARQNLGAAPADAARPARHQSDLA